MKYKSIITRFLKGAIAVEIPIVVAQLGNLTDITNIAQVKSFAINLILPTITGLLLAFEKWISWKD